MHNRPRPTIPPQPTCPPPPPAEQTPPSLSPMLTALLSVTLGDGFTCTATPALLREIMPYLDQADSAAVQQILRTGDALRSLLPPCGTPCPPPPRCWLTPDQRFLGLLDVLQRYGGQSCTRNIEQLRRYIQLRARLRALQWGDLSRLPDLAAMLDGGGSGAAESFRRLMPMLGMFTGGQINMQQILQMMGNLQK